MIERKKENEIQRNRMRKEKWIKIEKYYNNKGFKTLNTFCQINVHIYYTFYIHIKNF